MSSGSDEKRALLPLLLPNHLHGPFLLFSHPHIYRGCSLSKGGQLLSYGQQQPGSLEDPFFEQEHQEEDKVNELPPSTST